MPVDETEVVSLCGGYEMRLMVTVITNELQMSSEKPYTVHHLYCLTCSA